MDDVNLLGARVDAVSVDDVLTTILDTIQSGQRALIAHVHVMAVNIAYENDWFRQFLKHANLVYCDGMGVKLGARFLGRRIPQRLTLADWVWQLAEMAECQNFSFYLLGNPPGVAEKAAACLQKRFPKLVVKGAQHGYFEKTPGSPENQVVLQQINAAQPDILMVGFGMPAQELWLMQNWDELDVRVAITVGALFEYLAGDLPRGPSWMVENYMEWLYRLIRSPRRYIKRYLRDNPLFLYRLLKHKFFSHKGRSSQRRSDQ
ncbi:WecB/TagA/CpsF family glycosyltransferase [Chloroflexota bacterium]